MRLDIDQLTAGKPAWDFTIAVNGRDYPTRMPTIGLFEKIKSGAATRNATALFALVGELFVDPAPHIAAMRVDEALAAIMGYWRFAAAWTARVSAALAPAVRQALPDGALPKPASTPLPDRHTRRIR